MLKFLKLRGLRPALRSAGALIGAIVFATLAAWTAAHAHMTGQSAISQNDSFVIALPLIVQSGPSELMSPPAADATATPTDPPTNTPTSTPTATPTNSPTPTPTNPPGCDPDAKKNLRVRLLAPNIAEITNTSQSCSYPVGFASYRMFDDNLSHQQLFSSQTAVIGAGQTLTFTIDLPACAYQADVFYGPLIEKFDPGKGLFYGQRILVTRVVRDAGICAPGDTTPTPSATPSPTPTEEPGPGS